MGKTIAVIGAGPGLGNAIARKFAKEGFHAVLMARRAEVLERSAQEFADEGLSVSFKQVDCASNNSVRAALAEVEAERGSVDALAFNAAVMAGGAPFEISPEELLARHQVDVVAALTAAQAVVPGMRERGDGALLFTGGGLGLSPNPGATSMSLDKASLRALAFVLNEELEGSGVYAGIVNVRGGIGTPGYEPAFLAELFWGLYQRRDQVEITY